MTDSPRFLADEMLGRLARWLRLAGVDVEYAHGEDDRAILERARASTRILLTRDEQLAARARPASLLIRGLDPSRQFAEVRDAYALSLDEGAWLTRCTRCNALLLPARREDVTARVPASVSAHVEVFQECPACAAVYWAGTHVARIRVELARLRSLKVEG